MRGGEIVNEYTQASFQEARAYMHYRGFSWLCTWICTEQPHLALLSRFTFNEPQRLSPTKFYRQNINELNTQLTRVSRQRKNVLTSAKNVVLWCPWTIYSMMFNIAPRRIFAPHRSPLTFSSCRSHQMETWLQNNRLKDKDVCSLSSRLFPKNSAEFT